MPEREACTHRSAGPTSLRLPRRVDLLLGYVDLHSRTQLADLSERADRREVSPVRLVESLLAVVVLDRGFALHPDRVEALNYLHLQPGGHHPLGQQAL